MQTLKYVWNADIEVSVEWRHWDISGMQTSGYQWNTDIGVSVECGHWGISRMQPLGVSVEYSHWDISGMQTLGYQWNTDIGVSVECGCWGMRSWTQIFGGAQVSQSMNCAARLILKSITLITSLLFQFLHWLPVPQRIQ